MVHSGTRAVPFQNPVPRRWQLSGVLILAVSLLVLFPIGFALLKPASTPLPVRVTVLTLAGGAFVLGLTVAIWGLVLATVYAKLARSLLGPLASRTLQRRFIVHGTKDRYLLASEAVEDGYAFLTYPVFGFAGKSLASVREFGRVIEEHAPELSLSDGSVINEELVEHDPHWAKLRNAAKAVLRDLGADLEEWEHEQLRRYDA